MRLRSIVIPELENIHLKLDNFKNFRLRRNKQNSKLVEIWPIYSFELNIHVNHKVYFKDDGIIE